MREDLVKARSEIFASMLREALRVGIPVIVGSAGHAGARPHLDWTVEIVKELARENQWHFKVAPLTAR